MAERPIYRPYALLAFGATVAVGTPLGLWLLAAHYAGARAVGVPWVFLHAHVQILGFFGTLIVGVAPHLLARFTGRPLPARGGAAGALLLALALALRLAGTATTTSMPFLVAAGLEATVFALFTARVWRALDPPPLARLRRHLTIASGWLAVATVTEFGLRLLGAIQGTARPTPPELHELHVLALLGGVVGWVLGVLLRAGPMFVAGWAPPATLAAAVPWLLGLGALLAAGGRAGHGLVARTGELIVVATFAATIVSAGAFRRVERALPLVGRGGDERRFFMIAAASLIAAFAGAVANVVAAAAGTAVPLLPDAVRHLLTVGVLGGIVIAMSFRLMPVLEGRALAFPALRRVALVGLAAAVIGRTAEILVPLGVPLVRSAVTLSGVLAWIAFACVLVNLVALSVPAAWARRASARATTC